MGRALDFSPHQALLRARLTLATTRGLFMDLLLTGERDLLDETAELFAQLLLTPRGG
jgi:hypothetical protein